MVHRSVPVVTHVLRSLIVFQTRRASVDGDLPIRDPTQRQCRFPVDDRAARGQQESEGDATDAGGLYQLRSTGTDTEVITIC